jgi:hypothetical protein
MRLQRGPKTGDTWTTTDARPPATWVKSWFPGRSISFDGTIDKTGQRHTSVGVEIDEEDVLALHRALIDHYRSVERERNELRKKCRELERAFWKVQALVSWRSDRAPDSDSLLAAVAEIANYFAGPRTGGKQFKSRFRWMKWKTL